MKVHMNLPKGYVWATEAQLEQFAVQGYVLGARVCYVGGDLAVKLRPPETWFAVRGTLPHREAREKGLCASEALAEYIREYNNGWQAGGLVYSEAWDSGMTGAAWDDGYLDRAAGRPKWHLTHCRDHDVCGEG